MTFIDHIILCRSQDTVNDGNTTGIHPPPDRKIDVVFHILIPANAWGWSEKCRVHLRFGHYNLGNWNKNVGDFHFLR